MSKSANKIRFTIYAIAFIPFILLLATGVILLKYHTGAPLESTVMGWNAHYWFSFHKLTAVLSILLILLHLFVKTDWVKNLLLSKLKARFKASNIILFIVFIICSLTALCSWLIFDGANIAELLRGIHNKLGLLLIVMFVIHLWNYRKVIVSHCKELK
ncbi:hypothetical protein BZG02_06750 [Labilibaculum filiforme]|uniref:DUF4405 domain-containing protein n=1 Tax=Labilibaculum filiforme TaxID=1940526 RepID=A0A2N3I2G3_9BACT|nr:DUF4405 domain-containing protein [Labilibaculum filiforme]PKQ64500.1 hypothetical protein BZG02_06750 [Labilibaculum filiforme]